MVPLTSPDVLHAELPENPLCLITDDGSSLAPVLAKALSEQGWSPVILCFSGISAFVKKKRKPFAKEIMRVCENHARLITDDDSSIKVIALS